MGNAQMRCHHYLVHNTLSILCPAVPLATAAALLHSVQTSVHTSLKFSALNYSQLSVRSGCRSSGPKMVLYFTSDVVSPPYMIYMGDDKFENEELIRWGWPEDVWFHVDKESSAHVYLRLRPGETLDDIPSSVIDDCAQLVKANSIKGNKLSNIDVIYTFWSNLKKTADMEIGQIGFHDSKNVRSVRIERRINDIVNRLNKTKDAKQNVDFRSEREERDRKERNTQKEVQRNQKVKEKEEAKRKEEAQKVRSYDYVMKSENMTTNENGYDSDDFM